MSSTVGNTEIQHGDMKIITDIEILCFFIAEEMKCNSTQWKCNSGQCIEDVERCDFRKHCLDSSDEENCEIPSKGKNHGKLIV